MTHLLKILLVLFSFSFIYGICHAEDEDTNILYLKNNHRLYKSEYEDRYEAYAKSHKELSYESVLVHVNIGLDKPFYTNIKTVADPSSTLVLLNKYNKLPDGFLPEGFSKDDVRVLKFRADVQAEFEKMQAAAKSEGRNIFIVSGYRSYGAQNSLYATRKSNGQNPDNTTARAGHSEHHTGLTSDFNTTSYGASFEKSKEYKWLMENAHEYGFILRYPEGKKWITGYNFEPWHWRYVGKEAAGVIKEMNMTFEEYIVWFGEN